MPPWPPTASRNTSDTVSYTHLDVYKRQATCCPCEVDVLSGRYVIDAKSIMGLFSLDLSHPVKVEVHGSDADRSAFEQSVAAFEVKQTQ